METKGLYLIQRIVDGRWYSWHKDSMENQNEILDEKPVWGRVAISAEFGVKPDRISQWIFSKTDEAKLIFKTSNGSLYAYPSHIKEYLMDEKRRAL